MGVLKFASKGSKTLDLGEGDFLEVREGVSKKQFRSLLDKLPEEWDSDKGFTPGQADDFSTALFDMLVIDWSLVDEEGAKVPASVDNYVNLERGAAATVDVKLVEHFNELTPSTEERSKSKRDSK